LQEKVPQAFYEFLEVYGVGGFAGVFFIADKFHVFAST
jgi:hypothetical protein